MTADKLRDAIVAEFGRQAQQSGAYFDDDRAEGDDLVMYDGLLNVADLCRAISAVLKTPT